MGCKYIVKRNLGNDKGDYDKLTKNLKGERNINYIQSSPSLLQALKLFIANLKKLILHEKDYFYADKFWLDAKVHSLWYELLRFYYLYPSPANLVIQKKIPYKNLRGCKSPEKLMTIFSKYKMSKKIKNVSIFSVKTLGVSSRAVGSTKIWRGRVGALQ